MAREYYEVTIHPSDAGFGEYDVSPDTGDHYTDLCDLIADIRNNVGAFYILSGGEVQEISRFSDAEMPAEAEDICGRIHNEPPIVLVYTGARAGDLHYAGIDWIDA